MLTAGTRTRTPRVLALTSTAAAAALLLTACGGGGFNDGGSGPGTDAGTEATSEEGTTSGASGSLEILIGSSGDAETAAVKKAVADWSASSGVEATVNVASDLVQQLAQGFAAGTPADLFYVQPEQFPGYASTGVIEPYFDKLANADDFYPTLVDSFTYEGTPYCAPKDFSTLALIINTSAWEAAGLTDSDIPTTWDELETVAKKLGENSKAGLSFAPEYARIGAFMVQAGGSLVSDGAAVVDSDKNVEGLTFAKELLTEGAAQFPGDLGAGWGGEAFGTGAAAMVIEGNWVVGALANDYPDLGYKVVELPAGPAGKGTLQFTVCWGLASDSKNKDSAMDLVSYLTSDAQQMAFAKGFGIMPSISTVADEWKAEFPEQAAFLDGADYAQGVPPIQGISDVIADFNSQLETLKTADPSSILSAVQSNLAAIIK